MIALPLRAVRGACGLALLVVCALASAHESEPFRIRNLNPLTAIFGLPGWETAESGTRLRATGEIANHYRFSARNGDRLALDGETLRVTASWARGFGEGWSVGVDVPLYQMSGGHLDDLIDGWHSAFGLPDGARNLRPEDSLLFLLGNAREGQFFALERRARALGDVQITLARELGGVVLQGTLKLPTGDEDVLAGSGAADVAVTMLRLREETLGGRAAGFYWGAGVLAIGEPKRVAFPVKDAVVMGVLGGSLQVGPRFGVKAQLDVHGALYDTPLEEIGETAIQATVGAWVRAGRRSLLEFAIVEDVEVSTAPDVVLHVAAHWQW